MAVSNTTIGTRITTHSPVPFRQFGGGPRAWAGVIGTWRERSRQRSALAELDDRLIDDIGVTRSKARQAAAMPFWSVGKA
jgi:uncharacterized protein YjiS (DUF1127 family)